MNQSQRNGQRTLRRVSRSPSPVSRSPSPVRAVETPGTNTESYTGLEVSPLPQQGQVATIKQNINAAKRPQSATYVPLAHAQTVENKNSKQNAPVAHYVHSVLARPKGSRHLIKTRRRKNRRSSRSRRNRRS